MSCVQENPLKMPVKCCGTLLKVSNLFYWLKSSQMSEPGAESRVDLKLNFNLKSGQKLILQKNYFK